MRDYETKRISATPDAIAPDGSEIRYLPVVDGGSMVHCQLLPGTVTKAVRHRSVEELWYVLSGEGEIWRKQGDHETVTALLAGVSISLPLGTHFQFRCTGNTPLEIIIVTLPPWPGDSEAIRVADYWSPAL